MPLTLHGISQMACIITTQAYVVSAKTIGCYFRTHTHWKYNLTHLIVTAI